MNQLKKKCPLLFKNLEIRSNNKKRIKIIINKAQKNKYLKDLINMINNNLSKLIFININNYILSMEN